MSQDRPPPRTSEELYDKCDGDLDPSIAAQFEPIAREMALQDLTRALRKGTLSTAQYEALVARLKPSA